METISGSNSSSVYTIIAKRDNLVLGMKAEVGLSKIHGVGMLLRLRAQPAPDLDYVMDLEDAVRKAFPNIPFAKYVSTHASVPLVFVLNNGKTMGTAHKEVASAAPKMVHTALDLVSESVPLCEDRNELVGRFSKAIEEAYALLVGDAPKPPKNNVVSLHPKSEGVE